MRTMHRLAPTTGRTRTARLRPSRRVLSLLIGAVLAIAGLSVILVPLVGMLQRGRADDSALSQWHQGGAQASAGAVPGAAPLTSGCGSSIPTDSYALVTFPSLPQHGYAAVAGDGTWDLLLQRSMVHYQGTAAPGQPGNSIIGFHREPHFEYIDQLGVGALVDVQDRSCHTWHYQITQRWVLPPEHVTQLGPTSDAELTLVTCTPWFQDTERLVWRGVLLDDAGRPVAPVVLAPGWTPPLQPVVSVPFSPTASASPRPSSRPSPTPRSTPTVAPTPSSSPTPTPTATPTPPAPTPTASPAPTATASPTPSAAPTPSPLPPTPTP